MKKIVAVVLGVMMAAGFAMAGDMPDALMKGSWELGGGFSFKTTSGDYYENTDGDGSTDFSIHPDLGYFIMDGLVVGASLEFSSHSQGDVSNGTFGLGPFVNYYFPLELGPGHPYGHLSYLYNSMSFDNGTTDGSDSFTRLMLGVGYDVPLNEHVGIYGLIHYDMDSFTPDGGDAVDGNQMGLMVGLKVFHF